MDKLLLPHLGALFLVLVSCSTTPPGSPETAPLGPQVLSGEVQQAAMSGTVRFREHVAPILEMRCLPCHHGPTLPGLFSMTSRAEAFQPGPSGARIVPGHPEQSLLFLNPSGTHQAVQAMPPAGNRLTENDLAVLRRWIAQGAAWPEGPAGTLAAPAE